MHTTSAHIRNNSRAGFPHLGRSTALGAIAVVALGLTSCAAAAEKITEEIAEKAIENETGEDVEIDFDNGGIKIDTGQGSAQVGEDGTFVIKGEDGEVITGGQTDDGFTVTGQDGSVLLNIDEDSGQVSAESEDGSFSSGPGIPSQWPSSVLQPAGLTDVNGSVISGDGSMFITIAGTASQGAFEYFDTYESALESGGFNRSSYFEGDGFRQGTYEGGDYTVSVAANEATANIAITLMPLAG